MIAKPVHSQWFGCRDLALLVSCQCLKRKRGMFCIRKGGKEKGDSFPLSHVFIAFNSYKEDKVGSNLSIIDQALKGNNYCIETRQTEASHWLLIPFSSLLVAGLLWAGVRACRVTAFSGTIGQPAHFQETRARFCSALRSGRVGLLILPASRPSTSSGCLARTGAS